MDDGLPTPGPATGTRRPVGRPVRVPRAQRLPDAAPPQWHRGLTVVAITSLFIGTRTLWTQATTSHPVVAAIVTVCYAGILTCGVLALAVRGRRALAKVDLAILGLAIALVLCHYWLNHAGSDEGVLTAQAANAILHGGRSTASHGRGSSARRRSGSPKPCRAAPTTPTPIRH